MPLRALTYEMLQWEVKKRFFTQLFTQGFGGPLLFLWVLSTGILWVVLAMPFYALLVTGVCLASGSLMLWESFKDTKRRNQIIHTLISERFQLEMGAHGQLREELSQGMTYVTEIVLKIVDVLRDHGEDEDLYRVFADVNEMLSLQFESAKQIMEFHRMLTLVESPQGIHGKPKQREIRTDGSVAKLHHKNIESIKVTIAEAETSIGEVNQNLATLMLQVTQMANRVSDLVTVAQFREETAQTLRSIQTVVDARRETVHELVRWITPERA